MVVTATLGPSSGCGGAINATDEFLELSPPINPQTGHYWANLRCEWTIRVPDDPNKVIELEFTSLEVKYAFKMNC